MPESADVDRIHTLSSVLASQIAAGEVIERPASVVKELIENSLDAGAQRIRIDVEAAGSRLIRVRDDGHGIHPEDLPLALAPHSTSKLRTAADLARITSLGFRGEALASIAAIARIRICSRRSQAAYEIVAKPGAVPAAAMPAAHPQGTVIEVRDLFYNVPARRKFLRTPQTEFLHILELVRSLSLCRPGLGLALHHDNRQVFSVAAGADVQARIAAVFGRGFRLQACQVQQSENGISLSGLAGRPEAARSQADRQYVFLNGRLVRDRRLNHALRMAYAEQLPPGRYAPFLLYIEMDPTEYDINVHPTKHEVRFRHMRQVHDFLYAAMRRALDDNHPGDSYGGSVAGAAQAVTAPSAVAEQGPAFAAGAAPAKTARAEPGGQFGQPLGMICGRYLLTSAVDACWIIDCPRATAQLTMARLQAGLDAGPLPARPLLVPESAPAPAAIADALDRARHRLQQAGIRLELSGPDRAVLRELPAQYPATDNAALLRGLLSWLQAGGDFDSLLEVLVRHATDANRPVHLHEPEQRQLLRELDEARQRGLVTAPWPWRRLDASGLATLLEQADE